MNINVESMLNESIYIRHSDCGPDVESKEGAKYRTATLHTLFHKMGGAGRTHSFL